MGVMKRLSESSRGYRGQATRVTTRGKTTRRTTKSPKKVVEFTIEGLPEVTAKLKSFEPKIARKHLARATRTAAKFVLAAVRALVPVLTGALQKSLRVRAKVRTRKNKNDIGASVTTSKGWFKGDTYYGGFIEFGTEHIEARAFLRGGADKVAEETKAEFRRALVASVDEAAKGVA